MCVGVGAPLRYRSCSAIKLRGGARWESAGVLRAVLRERALIELTYTRMPFLRQKRQNPNSEPSNTPGVCERRNSAAGARRFPGSC